jgi:phospholipase C
MATKNTGSANLSKINHIVVLMLENRSFDSMLGWLYEDKSPAEFEGLNRQLWNPLDNRDANGVPFIEKVPIRKNGESTWLHGREIKHPEDFTLPNPDPGEGYRDTNHQLFEYYDAVQYYPPEPTNRGFVNNYRNANLYSNYSFGDKAVDPREIMATYTPEQLPVLSELARHYAVCDHWYCSVPSQTLCNRDFVHAASSSGSVNNSPNAICDAPTIYNRMQTLIDGDRDDLSWRVYGNNPMKKEENRPGREDNPDYFSLTRIIMSQLHDPALTPNFQTLDQFYRDCKKSCLPSYSFLEPNFGGPDQNDQHPPSDVRAGEKLIADVYKAVSSSKQWEQTLLIITYDEHGGCYDHVAPPSATPPDPAKPPGEMDFLFNRMGVRVPAVLVSPYIKKGTVCRAEGWVPFDHTSILATAFRAFDLGEPLTERDKAAPDLGVALSLAKPRKDKARLKPRKYSKQQLPPHALHDALEEVVSQMTGKRRREGEDLLRYLTKNHHGIYKKRGAKNK